MWRSAVWFSTPVSIQNLLFSDYISFRRDNFFKDLLRFDTKLQRWDSGFNPLPFEGRAYHTATVLADKIWVIGGSSADAIFSDVWVFDILSQEWEKYTVR